MAVFEKLVQALHAPAQLEPGKPLARFMIVSRVTRCGFSFIQAKSKFINCYGE
jgi:hypothetical protein